MTVFALFANRSSEMLQIVFGVYESERSGRSLWCADCSRGGGVPSMDLAIAIDSTQHGNSPKVAILTQHDCPRCAMTMCIARDVGDARLI